MFILKPKILVIEDEISQVELLRYNLEEQGFIVSVAMDGEEGVIQALEVLPKLVLLDWMLPKISGIEVCRQLRRKKATRDIPIIMLTARSAESDKVRGLDIGADDFITKPYSVKELIARINAAMRRPAAAVVADKLIAGNITIDTQNHEVFVNNFRVETSPTEYRLLTTFVKFPERVFSREQLLDMVWGISSDIDTRTVDVHVGRLRKTLQAKCNREVLRTVRGFGYSLRKLD